MTKTKIAKGMTMSCLTVSDIKKTKHLLVDILGLECTEHAEEYNWMEFKGEDGGYIGAGQPCGEGMKAGVNASLSISVDNIEEAKAHLESHGVTVGEINEIPGHVKLAPFKDEDGNEFFLAQKLD